MFLHQEEWGILFGFETHNNILAGMWMKSGLHFSCAYASTTMMQVAILK
jgi:hypothetical protein